MGKKVIALILALVLPVFLLAGCGAQKETTAGSGNVIKVGFAGPLSGASGQVGASCYNGALMAFNERKAELEEKSGCTLEFVTNDDQSDPTVAVTIGQKMVSDPDVLIIIGHCNSSCTISSSAITCPAELGMVTGQSTNVDVTDRGLKGILRVCQRDDFEAPATARFCKDSLGIQTIFLVNDQQAFGAGQCEAFAAEAAQIGLDVVANEGIVSNEVDFSAVVNQIAAANPDAVYYGGNYPEGSLLLKQIRDKGITSIYVGSSGVDTSELVNIAGKENAAGAYYISSSPAFDSSAVLQEWVDRYQQTSGLAADGYAIYFYEAAAVALESLSNAIDAAGGKPTRAQVVEAMANVEITSITGTFQFDEKGDNINAKAYAYEIVDGYPGKLVGELTGA